LTPFYSVLIEGGADGFSSGFSSLAGSTALTAAKLRFAAVRDDAPPSGA
jgi:hypothetical protein